MSSSSSESESSHVYATRFRGKMEYIKRKYDDIFSSVVEKALSDDTLRVSPPPVPKPTEDACEVLNEKTGPTHRKRSSLSFNHPVVPRSRKRQSHSESNSSFSVDLSDESREIEVSVSPSLTKMKCTTIADVEECVEVPVGSFVCECRRTFESHLLLHKHLCFDHSPSLSSRCAKCGISSKAVRNAHICRICQQFVVSMDMHLRSHYQDRSGSGALMECRHCYKTFETLDGVREHERRVHFKCRNRLQSWACQYCEMDFPSRHMRDSHLVSHIDRAVGGVWDRIAKMQELVTDQILVNQCPLCFSVMGSRKSFRLHIIHKHLLQDPHHFMTFLGLPTMNDVIADFSAPSTEIKTEGEVIIHEKSVVKTEPIEADDIKQEPLD